MKFLLHIIIPTFERPQKLSRQVDYLNRCINADIVNLAQIAITIIDGSRYESEKVELIRSLRINYLHIPTADLIQRICIGLSAIDAHTFMVLGDDDFISFTSAYELAFQLVESDFICMAGRFVNIDRSSSPDIINLSFAERPYHSFEISDSEPLLRMNALRMLNSVGVASLSYSIQKECCKDFYQSIRDLFLYHGGVEFIHQCWIALSGPICFPSTTLIYRDFTYYDYVASPDRIAPDSDQYPYIGESAVNWISAYIEKTAGLGNSEAIKMIRNHINLENQLGVSKQFVQRSLEESLLFSMDLSELDGVEQEFIQKCWTDTFRECYPRVDTLMRIKLRLKRRKTLMRIIALIRSAAHI